MTASARFAHPDTPITNRFLLVRPRSPLQHDSNAAYQRYDRLSGLSESRLASNPAPVSSFLWH